jgi:cytochrome c biogenesis protein CcdA
VIRGDFALAFSAGMIATVNPCGFAMLPAYLSYFLGLEAGTQPAWRNVARALAVGSVLTLGFIVVFGVMGIIHEQATQSFERYTPHATIVIGIVLVVLGVAMLRGFEPKLRLPRLDRGGGSRELPSMFVFGVSYAIASLGCTIAPFLAAVAPTFSEQNFVSGLASFVLYGLGMGTVVISLTIAIALAKTSLTTTLRSLMPHVNRIAGVLLIPTGLYLAYYGWYAWRVQKGRVRRDPIVRFFENIQTDVQSWISDFGPVRLGFILTVLIAGALALAYLLRRPSTPTKPERRDVTVS